MSLNEYECCIAALQAEADRRYKVAALSSDPDLNRAIVASWHVLSERVAYRRLLEDDNPVSPEGILNALEGNQNAL